MNLIEESRNGTTVTIGVRAEDIAVTASPASGFDEARVVVVEPMGSETLVTLEYRGQPLIARAPGNSHFDPGQTVSIHFPADRTVTFDTDGARLA